MERAETPEQAIELVRAKETECQVDWYSLGKTNADLRSYLEERAIDASGVFIAGSFEEDSAMKLTFMPESWVDRDIVQCR